MSSHISRRQFLNASTVGALSTGSIRLPGFALEAFARVGQPRLRLSLAAYSFREDLSVPKGSAEGTAPKMDMFKFIDYCADHGCDGAELTSYYFPLNSTDEYLRQVRRHAFLRGVSISGTAVGNTFVHPSGPEREKEVNSVKMWIDRAVELGAPHIRVFAGDAKGLARKEAVHNCIEALEECAEYAGQWGVFLGVENHGGIVSTPDELLEIIEAVKSPWVGVNLDTGNFHGEDPYSEIARCAPYAVNVQYKSEIRRKGQKQNEPADLKRVVKILRDAKYQGWVALEFEATEDPWRKIPEILSNLGNAFRNT